MRPDVAIVLGGDGTMLRALTRFLGTGVPVIGVNYGRVGFLTTIRADRLEDGARRVFAGEYQVVELSTLEVSLDEQKRVAVNDVVVAGGTLGRMVELGYAIGGEDLGVQPCDGLICASPGGSTAYNLSNGGPVLVWGIDAMVLTFVAPHTLHIRPLVVPRGPRARDHEPYARARGDRARGRTAGRPAARGRQRDGAPRSRPQPARDAARGHVLQPLRRHLRAMSDGRRRP